MDEMQSEKLDRFVNSVNAEVDEKISGIISEAEDVKKAKLEKAENEALQNAYNKIQRSVKETEAKYRRMLAMKQQQLRIDSLKHREALAEHIFESVKKKVSDFVVSDKYKNYIISLLNDISTGENSVILISANDEKYIDALKKASGCTVKTDSSIEIGGLSVIDTQKGIVIDKTLDSALEEQRKNFSSRYSFRNEAVC